MSIPFVGEIRLLPFFRGAPSGWLACDGSLQQVSAFDALFALLSTTYGGDGTTTFGLPDLRSRVPVHQGSGSGLTPRTLGSSGGVETVAVATPQLGAHAHTPLASTSAATATSPSGTVPAAVPPAVGDTFYVTAPDPGDAVDFPADMLQPSGGGGQHDNTAPTLALQYCIAWNGQYPARS